MANINLIGQWMQRLAGRGLQIPKDADAAEILSFWGEVFAEVPDEIFASAANEWASTTTAAWWPMPGQVMEIARRSIDAARGRCASPDAAWAEVLRLRRLAGPHLAIATGRDADYDAPAPCGSVTPIRWYTIEEVSRRRVRGGVVDSRIHHDRAERHAMEAGILAAGGWGQLLEIEAEAGAAARASFRGAYTAVRERELRSEDGSARALDSAVRRSIAGEAPAPRLGAAPEALDFGAELAKRQALRAVEAAVDGSIKRM